MYKLEKFDKIVAFALRPWVIASFVSLAILSYFYIDKPLAQYFNIYHLRDAVPILNIITNIGLLKIYLFLLPTLALLFAYVFHRKDWSIKILTLLIFILYSSVIASCLKLTLGRARPVLLFDTQTFGFFGWSLDSYYHSFPSGHTTTIVALALGLIILFPRYCWLFVVVGLTVMVSRILLTYHYLSDVLVSCYLVILELGLFAYIIRRKYPKICELVLK